MTDIQIFLTELDKQKERIDGAIQEISAGQIPNMSDIERDLTAIAGAIETAPPHIAKQTEQPLRDVISRLETLVASIQDFQTQLKNTQTDN